VAITGTPSEPGLAQPRAAVPVAAAASVTVMAGILAVSFNLRIGIVTVGPLIDEIRHATGMSSGVAGLLGAVPFLCMGIFALVGPWLAARVGSAPLIGYALATLALGTVARAVAPTAALVVVATVPIGIGIALTSLALPGVIKENFPGRSGAATGSYVAALALGGGLAAVLVVPLADALGGWREAFVLTSLPAFLALPVWMHARGEVREDTGRMAALADATDKWRPGSRGVRLGLMFGLQSMCFASVISWVAALYRHEGWGADHAALTTAAVSFLVAPAGLVLPRLSEGRDRRIWVFWTAVVMSSAVLGLAIVPGTLPWLWVIAFGLGTGSIFSLMLTLPLDLGGSQAEVDELTGWMLGLGYILAAAAPALVGVGRDVTGSFGIPLIVMAVLGFGAGFVALSPALERSSPGGGGR
jgi:CP family cyanate transporter-like MFS transporter